MDRELLDIFGLTKEQLKVMYVLEGLLAKRDSSTDIKHSAQKNEWIEAWLKTIDDTVFVDTDFSKLDDETLEDMIEAVKAETKSNTWLYLVFLEASLFNAYFPLDEDERKYNKLKYSLDVDYLMGLAKKTGVVEPSYIERCIKVYSKSYKKLSGRTMKIAIRGVAVLAIAAIGAALAAVFAPSIAVALIGESFAGLNGAALVSACLASLGGGAIALGGFGMAGGVAAIAGGGALLGLAGGGVVAGVTAALVKKSPELTLSQAAKLEVVMKEILLNEQKDTMAAQAVIAKLKEQIKALNAELVECKLEMEGDKKELKNLEQSLKILTKAVRDMGVFESAFEIGLSAEQ